VEVAADADATALGAAALAGLAVGVWRDVEEVGALIRRGPRYEPSARVEETERRREEWRQALRRVTVGL
jgi:glycerol kinase